MGSMVVVAVQPVGSHVTHLLQVVEDVVIEHLGTVDPFEAFNIGVLCGFAGLNVLRGVAFAVCPGVVA